MSKRLNSLLFASVPHIVLRLRHHQPVVRRTLIREMSTHGERTFSIVVAATLRGGIGYNGDLPWKRQLKSDLKHFEQVTSTVVDHAEQTIVESKEESARMNAVIMGRKTWTSLPNKHRPLQRRINVVVTRQRIPTADDTDADTDVDPVLQQARREPNTYIASSLQSALKLLSEPPLAAVVADLFVIGGASLYAEAMHSPQCDRVLLTSVLADFECDTHLEPIDSNVYRLQQIGAVKLDDNIPHQILTYVRERHAEEYQYLNLIRRVLRDGNIKSDRTNTGTRSLFGVHMRFDLSQHFPLLTTKRVFVKGVICELLWMIQGRTDNHLLQKEKVHIWDGNGTRHFLDQLGLTDRAEGDLGPIYGFQWRHFGATYVNSQTDYAGKGVDQLMNIITTIKKNPNDRRLIISAWNATDLHLMALPPCHVLCQFYVSDGRLSCQMYQRSCDIGLGVPFNIASYAFLTHIVAHMTGLAVGEFVYCMGDAHIYNNHVAALEEQIKRRPYDMPTLKIQAAAGSRQRLEDWTIDDFLINNYQCHPPIKMDMAA